MAAIASADDAPQQAKQWLQAATDAQADIQQSALQSIALADLAATWGRFDIGKAEALERELADPGLKAFCLAIRAARLGPSATPESAALLRDATEQLHAEGNARHKAYAGYVVAWAWLDDDREDLLASADSLAFEPEAW